MQFSRNPTSPTPNKINSPNSQLRIGGSILKYSPEILYSGRVFNTLSKTDVLQIPIGRSVTIQILRRNVPIQMRLAPYTVAIVQKLPTLSLRLEYRIETWQMRDVTQTLSFYDKIPNGFIARLIALLRRAPISRILFIFY